MTETERELLDEAAKVMRLVAKRADPGNNEDWVNRARLWRDRYNELNKQPAPDTIEVRAACVVDVDGDYSIRGAHYMTRDQLAVAADQCALEVGRPFATTFITAHVQKPTTVQGEVSDD